MTDQTQTPTILEAIENADLVAPDDEKEKEAVLEDEAKGTGEPDGDQAADPPEKQGLDEILMQIKEKEISDEEVVLWLTTLKDFEFDRAEKAVAPALGIKVATLSKRVKGRRAVLLNAGEKKEFFRVGEKGVFKRIETEDGDEWKWFCSELHIEATTRNTEDREWGRLLKITTPEGRVHEWAMPMEMLAGDGQSYRAELLRLGLCMSPGKFARDALHEYLTTARPKNKARCVSRIGWHGKSFVLPDETIINGDEDERIILQTTSFPEHSFRTNGTIEDWQKRVAAPCEGNSRLVFVVSAAFAAPLIHPVGAESGGFHIRGSSSTGKTTALHVAGSVWGGGGLRGYVRQWRATANGLEGVATVHSDVLLCLDEISQVSSREAGEAAYLLANGQGKSRSRRDGSPRPVKEWRTLFLSSGEISLADKVKEDGRRRPTAGQDVRVVDISADAGAGLGLFENIHGADTPDAFARQLKQGAFAAYGTPGRAFLRKLSKDIDEVSRHIIGFKDEFIAEHCSDDVDGQVSRVADRFALVAAAGEFAIQIGLVPWSAGEAIHACITCFQSWIDNRGGVGAAETRQGIAAAKAFFELHGISRFEAWPNEHGDEPVRIINNRAGWRKKSGGEEWEYFVLPGVFNTEICVGLDAKSIAQSLVAKKYLSTDSDGKSSQSIRIPGYQRQRLYCFNSSIMSDENEEDKNA